MNTLMLVCILHKKFLFNVVIPHSCQNGYPVSFMIALIAECKCTKTRNKRKLRSHHSQNCQLFFNHSTFMDTKGPLNPASEGIYHKYVIFELFSKYNITVPTPKNKAQYAINALVHHWVLRLGPPRYLITDRGSEYPSSETSNCCTLINSPRTAYAPWTNGLVEVQNKNRGNHSRIFLPDTLEIALFKNSSSLILTILNVCHICIFRHME